ncbi:single-stranded DNA-binding protein [Methanocella sp. CWC-04]|uniref:Single-stranded DNA-binding protein n=1 Tax=Methanooceanicella nereidis TaxID=2052831 RepID=A0AAP2RDQ2_9EURY|nr:OB-fold nucleic acid binding domain-containing protein [Methanocella sp. CWC-04]MCD1295433.1 single-stranded DNA-binding protein [Methanocella sp. CWC-04]
MSDILDIYEKIGGKVTQKEFNKLIDEKMEIMGGLCDERTAALLVAHDLGVEGVNAIKIIDISLDKKNVEFLGKIISAFEPREFNRNDGTVGKVCTITVGDETGDVRVTLWDELAEAVKTGDLKEGDVIRVKGYVKEGQQGLEVHLGRGGGISKEEGETVNVKDPMISIGEVQLGMGNMCTRGVLLSKQDIRTFNRKDGSTGCVTGIIIGDETGKIKVTLWDNKAKEIDGFEPGDSIELLHGYTRESFDGSVEIQVGNRGMIRMSEIPVRYEEKVTKIGEIEPDKFYNIKGIVTGIDGVREFTTRDGKPGRLCSVHISDDSGRIRVVFWGEHANFAEALSIGDEILVTDVQSRVGFRDEMELSANWRSTVRRLK